MSSRGKKYTAAEKHFHKRIKQHESKITALTQEIVNLEQDVRRLSTRNFELQVENDKLHECIDRFLGDSDLSVEDLISICERDEKIDNFLSYMDDNVIQHFHY